MSRQEILSEAVKHFGKADRKRKAIEELAELTVALCHEDFNRDNARAKIVEEIADVQIMILQLLDIYNCGNEVELIVYQRIDRLKTIIDIDKRARLNQETGIGGA